MRSTNDERIPTMNDFRIKIIIVFAVLVVGMLLIRAF
jgi:hypothetical protein